jgi:Fe-Mn family superoxide dismutase
MASVDIVDHEEVRPMKHLLPPLPYAYDALEPYIDARTMTLHHDMHHASYVAALNSAIGKYPDLKVCTALWLLLNSSKVPKETRTTIRNNVGGHLNHSFFWRNMCPPTTGAPTGKLADALVRDFGSIDHFKAQFVRAGVTQFGSGWVWLARSKPEEGGRLLIYSTSGHDNPLIRGHWPILVNDVWEHAYYLKYENRRADYLDAWWAVVNWVEVVMNFDRSEASFQQHSEADEPAARVRSAIRHGDGLLDLQ